MRILVVEDERKVASFLRQGLQEEGHAVEVAADGAAALDLLLGEPGYDLAILDLMLPKRDGFDVLRTLRRRRVQTPVLILTARDAVPDKVTGLDLGADDYLTKPFAFEDLLARVRALLRRREGERAPVLALADLALDPATRTVTRGGRGITLTAREHALLESPGGGAPTNMRAPFAYRRWAWPAVAVLALAVAVLAPRSGYSTAAPTPLWSDRPLPIESVPVQAPNWVELAKAVKPAVVNISTKRVEEGMPALPGPRLGPDDPFQQFFRRFSPNGPRTVRSLGSGFVINPRATS